MTSCSQVRCYQVHLHGIGFRKMSTCVATYRSLDQPKLFEIRSSTARYQLHQQAEHRSTKRMLRVLLCDRWGSLDQLKRDARGGSDRGGRGGSGRYGYHRGRNELASLAAGEGRIAADDKGGLIGKVTDMSRKDSSLRTPPGPEFRRSTSPQRRGCPHRSTRVRVATDDIFRTPPFSALTLSLCLWRSSRALKVGPRGVRRVASLR